MKILLIEDDLFFQKFYSNKLKESGVEVEIAGDGEEGLIKMKSFNPNLVLLDLIMPKLDGFGVLTARLQDENLKKIPVIVFSTLGQEKDINRAKEMGANGYINKGFFDFNSLVATINQVMKSG
jgi:CheY-like chemotaxis protein